MKKSALKKFFQFTLSNSIKGLVIFLAFGTAAYVYAISYPATQPNAVSGVVGLFVGSTQKQRIGNEAGSYSAANNYCEADFEYSHICTAMEMTNTYNHAPTAFDGQNSSLWINGGVPGNATAVNNDCRGWNSASSRDFGSVWNPAKRSGYLTSCDLERSYACCK